MIDDTDVKILNHLLEDARVPLTSLSKSVGISSVAIQQRISKLEKKGVIQGYSSKIDYKLLGYKSSAFVGVFLEKAKFYKSVIKELNKIPEITESHFTTGSYSIFLKVYALDNEHLMKILNDRVQNITGIARTETFISLDIGVNKELLL